MSGAEARAFWTGMASATLGYAVAAALDDRMPIAAMRLCLAAAYVAIAYYVRPRAHESGAVPAAQSAGPGGVGPHTPEIES